MSRMTLILAAVAVLLIATANASLMWKTEGFPTARTTPLQVLILMPSSGWLRLADGSMVPVGSYLDEFAVPSLALLNAGATLSIATPMGCKPILDVRSNSTSYFNGNETRYRAALELWDTFPPLQNPWRITDLAVEEKSAPSTAVNVQLLSLFDALFIPGGHAPMIDLWPSTAVGRIIHYFASVGKRSNGSPTLVSALCHGPVTLAAAALLPDVKWPFIGRNMTVFSKAAEQYVERVIWGKQLGFYPPDILMALGGNVSEVTMFTSHVVQDGNLITGQNAQSAVAVGEAIVNYLLTH